MDKIEIGKFIQAERKKQSISQQTLADRLHSTRQTIICIEKGTANFNINLFLLILDTLGVKFEFKTPDKTISVDVETQGVDGGKLVVTRSDEPDTILLYDFRQVASAVSEDEPEPVIVTPSKKQRSPKSSKTFW